MSPSSRHASKRAGCYRQENNSIGEKLVSYSTPCADALALRSRLSTGQTTRSTFSILFLFCTFFRREVTRQGLDQHELGDYRERPLACMKKTPRVRRGNGTTAIWNGSHRKFWERNLAAYERENHERKGDETPSPRTSELEKHLGAQVEYVASRCLLQSS